MTFFIKLFDLERIIFSLHLLTVTRFNILPKGTSSIMLEVQILFHCHSKYWELPSHQPFNRWCVLVITRIFLFETIFYIYLVFLFKRYFVDQTFFTAARHFFFHVNYIFPKCNYNAAQLLFVSKYFFLNNMNCIKKHPNDGSGTFLSWYVIEK